MASYVFGLCNTTPVTYLRLPKLTVACYVSYYFYTPYADGLSYKVTVSNRASTKLPIILCTKKRDKMDVDLYLLFNQINLKKNAFKNFSFYFCKN